tara:strand:+ start:19 stop:423 length:405 start_codon:yes stop_codon:yes gene_type:complete
MVFLNNGIMQKEYEDFLQQTETNFISSTSAERSLFLAVILQALLDATQKDTRDLESSKIKREAILWFTSNFGETKKDFEYICHSARINPAYMRKVAMDILSSKRTNFIRTHINAILTDKDSYDRVKNNKQRKGK